MAIKSITSQGTIDSPHYVSLNSLSGWESSYITTLPFNGMSAYKLRFPSGRITRIDIYYSLSGTNVNNVDVYLCDNLPPRDRVPENAFFAGHVNSGTGWVSLYTDTYRNAPYIVIHNNTASSTSCSFSLSKVQVQEEADDTPPRITLISPVNDIVSKSEIEFSWRFIKQAYTDIVETRITIYSNNTSVWDYARFDEEKTSFVYSIPNVAIDGFQNPGAWIIEARTLYSDYGKSPKASFTALNSSAPVTSITRPNGVYQKRTSPITLVWSATNKKGEVTGAEIEYDLGDGSGWRLLDTVSGSANEYPVAANFFPAQNSILWRVKSKSTDGNIDLWGKTAEASFATIDAPITATPTKPISNASRNETAAIEFEWSTQNSLNSAPTGADIRWKVSGGSWEPIVHVDGAERAKTFTGGTFPGDVIVWQVRAYNQDGVAGAWSSNATFSTVDSPQVSTALTPNNTVEDADAQILFTFGTYSQSGEESRGFELEYSIDGSTWILFAQEGEQIVQETPGGLTPADTYGAAEGSASQPLDEHSYLAPANTIPPGVIFWHVRSYNRNLSPGEWSEAVSFVAKAAPIVQDLQVTEKPFATVIWQSNDQQNYEIFVDGKSLGIFFGTERKYPLPDYLKDGVHTIGLRVLGSFDLWSRISETQVTIENTPTSVLTLKAPTNIDTALEWTGGSGDFFVYRDGLMIAHTNAHSFTDRTALGEHDYQVVERLASGDYNASAVITRSPDVYCLHIAALSGGEWIPIPHRLKSDSDPEYSESQEVVYNHLAGVYEPVASIGQYRDDSGKYSAVFLFNEQEEHKRFRALRGKPVILKTADGEVVIGILHAWERKHILNHYRYAEQREMYAAYSFTIQRIGWGDYIDVP